MLLLGKILASSGTRPNPNSRPIGSTRPGQNGSRKSNLSKPVKIIRAQPVQPTRLPGSEYLVTSTPRISRDYPGSKEHDARYKARSCARSFLNDMSPIKDCAPEIGGRATRNIRTHEATSSSTTDPRIYQKLP
jgi:hypothetical protein